MLCVRSCDHRDLQDQENLWSQPVLLSGQIVVAQFGVADQLSQCTRFKILLFANSPGNREDARALPPFRKQGSEHVVFETARCLTRQVIAGAARTLVRLLENVSISEPTWWGLQNVRTSLNLGRGLSQV